jgi:hypothetical protein
MSARDTGSVLPWLFVQTQNKYKQYKHCQCVVDKMSERDAGFVLALAPWHLGKSKYKSVFILAQTCVKRIMKHVVSVLTLAPWTEKEQM